MTDKDNLLDNIFKEALGDYEVPPPASVKKGVFAPAFISSNNKWLWYFLLPFMLGIFGLYSIVWLADSGNISGLANSFLQRDTISYTHPIHNKNAEFLSNQNTNIENIEQVNNSTPFSNSRKQNSGEDLNANTNSRINTNNLLANNSYKTSNYSEVENTRGITKRGVIASNTNKKSSDLNEKNYSLTQKIQERYVSIEKLAPKKCDFLSEIPVDFDKSESNKHKQSWLWSANIYVGTNVWQPHNLIINKKDTDIQTSDFSEKNYSYHAGLSMMGEKGNFFFEMGLQYNNLISKNYADRILYNQQNHFTTDSAGLFVNYDTTGSYLHFIIVIDSVIRIIDTILEWKIDTSNMTLYDTSFYTTTKEVSQASWKNNFSFIEIPLAIGWKKELGRFSVRIGTGPVLSFLIAKRIKVPDEITAQEAFQTINHKFSGFKLGLSWQLLAVLSYRISERWSIELQPYGRYTLMPIKSDDKRYYIKNNNVGIQLGFRFFF